MTHCPHMKHITYPVTVQGVHDSLPPSETQSQKNHVSTKEGNSEHDICDVSR